MLKIKSVTALRKYLLHVVFDNGVEKDCDISCFLDKGCFKELKDESLFRQVRNAIYAVEWPNDLDLSSDTLMSLR